MFDDKTAVALQLADAMCGPTHELPGELIDAARAHWSDLELGEILLVAGQANLNNRVGNMAKQLIELPDD